MDVGEQRLDARHQRLAVEQLADRHGFGERCGIAGAVGAGAQIRIEIGRRRNATGERTRARLRQCGFGGRKYFEARIDSRRSAGEIHIAGRIFQADDALTEAVEQAADQRDVPVQARLRRVVIEINRNRLRLGRIHDCVDVGNQAVVVHAFVIERRQHQRAAEAERRGVLGQRDGVSRRGGAGPHHHAVERQAAGGVIVHDLLALLQRKRRRLAGGAEHVEAIAAI